MKFNPRLVSYSFVDVAAKRPDLREASERKLGPDSKAQSRYQLAFYGADANQPDRQTEHLLVAVGRFTVDTPADVAGYVSIHAHCVGEFQFAIPEPLSNATASDPDLQPYLLQMTEPTVRLYLQQLLQQLGLQIVLPVSVVVPGPVTYEEISQGTAVPFDSGYTQSTTRLEPTDKP